MRNVFFHSSSTLEPWDWTTPWTTGIGGSETSHIEMCQRLGGRGFEVTSYAPTPWKSHFVRNEQVLWYHHQYTDPAPGVWIYYRNPKEFDRPKPPNEKWWFISQDVDYPNEWTPERLSKVDRYITLCQEHSFYVLRRYPNLKGRLYQSSNGIRSDYIRGLLKDPPPREPRRMFYASSPDRGLKLLLEQWWRIRERVPDATLRIAYGFNNMEAIVEAMGPSDWRGPYQRELERLIQQDGVEWLGRLPQDRVYDEFLRAGVWPYPCDFPETSCITCMEAQACGATPVTNNHWALKDNVKHGFIIDGIPQKSDLIRHYWLDGLMSYLKTPMEPAPRCDMQLETLEAYDWERVVDQWERWLEEDLAKCTQ